MPDAWRFSGPGEAVFVLLMAVPLLFFAGCALYLWRLLLYALVWRGRIAVLETPGGSVSPVLPAETKRETPASAERPPRFALLIPAHNETLVIGAALESLKRLEYPQDAYRVLVIADNCTDNTAEIVRAHGAIALERFNKTDIGKGYALEWALNALLNAKATPDDAVSALLTDIADFEAVVVLDADTLVAPNLLTAFAAALKAGEQAMQARYEVLNVGESWRTKLMTCALALAHIVKPLGREHLRLSDGLKGNGMCFARAVVETVPWSGESITEDIEYALRLCRAGYRIAFLPNTAVWAQMPTTGAQSASQRQRWEGGRYRLLTKVAPALLTESFRTHNRILRDRAVELIIPPFAEMFALPVGLLLVSGLTALLTGWHGAALCTALWGVLLLLQAGYLFVGMWVARVPVQIAMTLLLAPAYIVWKFGVYAAMAIGRSAGGWKRTERREMQ